MPALSRHPFARLRALVAADPVGVRAGFVALCVSSATGLVAGLTLGAFAGRLEELPGLLVLVPAAIGMRGAIFGALGSRFGTAIHAGTFRFSNRPDTLVGQNLRAAMALSITVSLVLAFLAKTIATASGVESTITLADFVVVSMLGGFLSSIVVMVITVIIASWSTRRGWDLDNVAAPIVTSSGDVVTLPALVLAALLVEIRWVTPALAVALAVAGAVVTLAAWRSARLVLREVFRQSLPVLVVAGTIDVFAGVTVERSLETLVAYPVLLVLIPPFLGQSGSLGGILSARVSTKLHLGLVPPDRLSLRPVADDVLLVCCYAIPVFVVLGLMADLAAFLGGLASPGALEVLGVAVLAGTMTTLLVVAVGYGSAVAAHRLGLDPDNFGMPLVTSTLDFGGAFAVILAIGMLGLL